MSDVDGVFEIQGFHKFGNVGRIGVHVVAAHRLSGTTMPAPIMGNYSITVPQEEHHLGVPVVGRQRPSVMKEERLTRAPILVINLRAVVHCKGIHVSFSCLV